MEKRIALLKDKFEADPALVEKLISLDTPEDVQKLLKEQGLEFSLEEISAMKDAIAMVIEKGQSGEITDDALENVAGGISANNPIIIGPGLGLIIGPLLPPGGTRW